MSSRVYTPNDAAGGSRSALRIVDRLPPRSSPSSSEAPEEDEYASSTAPPPSSHSLPTFPLDDVSHGRASRTGAKRISYADEHSSDSESVSEGSEDDVAYTKCASGASDDGMRGGGRKRSVGGPSYVVEPTDLWSAQLNAALDRGLRLVPDVGHRRFKLGKVELGRNGLLSAYIRRQTGILRTKEQIRKRLQVLVRANADSVKLKQLIKGADVDPASWAGRDWDAFLGPDLYPHTVKKPKKEKKHKKRATSPGEPKKRQREEQPASSHLPQPLGFPSIPAPSSSTSSFLSASDLSAFFTTFCPSHSLTSSAAALHSSGLRTPDDLLRLMDLEDGTLVALLDGLAEGGKVSVLEKAWLRRAVEEGKKALAQR
ncbi:Transketolase [Rhodosporidiobolus nylandii]